MSFSSQVKEELSHTGTGARHCRIAELAAIITMCGGVQISGTEKVSVRIHTENLQVARRCQILLRETFNIVCECGIRTRNVSGKQTRTVCVCVSDDSQARSLLMALHVLDADLEPFSEEDRTDPVLLQKTCCRRAFIRGAFLASGSINDPEKSYHFEIPCLSESKAEQLCLMICSFGTDAKVTQRRKYHVVYLKDGSQIVDVLNIMNATSAMMELENVRIMHQMRGEVQRRVNCDSANINKTVAAAQKQIEDIRFLQETIGLENLPPVLQETAALRLEQFDVSLKDLGAMMDPPVGKSGVNHRLHKLSEMADALRDGTIPIEKENIR